VLQCTHQLPQQIWGIQGHTFKTTLKIIPLRGYDIILGMYWLEAHSPMEVHWADKWLQFSLNNTTVKLQGIQHITVMGPPVSQFQLQAMDKADSILYLVQLQHSQSPPTNTIATSKIPDDLQSLLQSFIVSSHHLLNCLHQEWEIILFLF
jgi:hypothetical protein